MPLTSKGKEILANFIKEYGEKQGTSNFYASINAGKITGAEASDASIIDADWSDYSARMHAALDRAIDEHIGFSKLENELAHKKGVRDPASVAAAIGRKKYGKAGMAKKAAAGRADDAEYGERMHCALDKLIDEVLDKRAIKQLQIVRGQGIN